MTKMKRSVTVRTARREQAEARQKAYDALSDSQKIARLDARLGAGVGAVRERAYLTA